MHGRRRALPPPGGADSPLRLPLVRGDAAARAPTSSKDHRGTNVAVVRRGLRSPAPPGHTRNDERAKRIESLSKVCPPVMLPL
jgi:hypothetical protein